MCLVYHWPLPSEVHIYRISSSWEFFCNCLSMTFIFEQSWTLKKYCPKSGNTVLERAVLCQVLVVIQVMWCDVIWCDVTWRDVVWRDVTWCDVMWRDVTWCDVMWCDVMWCDVMWRDVTWRDVTWRVMWCDVTWRDVTWRGVMCDVMWCDVMWCDHFSALTACLLWECCRSATLPAPQSFHFEELLWLSG